MICTQGKKLLSFTILLRSPLAWASEYFLFCLLPFYIKYIKLRIPRLKKLFLPNADSVAHGLEGKQEKTFNKLQELCSLFHLPYSPTCQEDGGKVSLIWKGRKAFFFFATAAVWHTNEPQRIALTLIPTFDPCSKQPLSHLTSSMQQLQCSANKRWQPNAVIHRVPELLG